ncbi:MAG: sulfur reduction protein DsrE [Betaproteobacteria bacterium]|nr:MAG: sulfur reduction protein DsrE [Betaproteobacteria bacterium]
MAEQHYLDNAAKSVVIVMTSGPSTPQRCATPFFMAALLASMDADVKVFFTMEGVKLCQQGVSEHLTAMDGGKKIIEFMRDAKAAGVRFHLCRPALPGYDIEVTNVIPEVDEISSGGALADLILSCDKALFF